MNGKEQMRERVLTDLMRLPEEINNQEAEILKLSLEFENSKKELKNYELELLASITNEKNDDGKPIFSNETLRTAELAKRMNAYLEAQRLREKVEKTGFALDVSKIQLSFLNNSFSSRRAMTRLLDVEGLP